jgi:hypothetical protein
MKAALKKILGENYDWVGLSDYQQTIWESHVKIFLLMDNDSGKDCVMFLTLQMSFSRKIF